MQIHLHQTQWREFPNGISADGQVFAIPDIHGRARVLAAALDHVAGLPAPPQMSRHLVFNGDITDRGKENFAAIDLVLSAQIRNGRRIVTFGNHDGMLLDGLDLPLSSGAFRFWHDNGGYAMLDELACGGTGSPQELRRKLHARLPRTWLERLRAKLDGDFRSHFVSGDLLFVHAGIPGYGREGNRNAADLDRFLAQPLPGATQLASPKHHWAWIRPGSPDWTGRWDRDGRRVIVHGHTCEYEGPITSDDEIFGAIDKIRTERRISLDLFGIRGGRLAVFEAIMGRYRLHVFEDRLLRA
ncbi:metallophosphoesterase [Paracoccus litorisediminis]|uniref:metallophosphoesterase n=1 Tax=Paracoccus litorisediminis TaxID=2006130 RepID=UPI0037312C9D